MRARPARPPEPVHIQSGARTPARDRATHLSAVALCVKVCIMFVSGSTSRCTAPPRLASPVVRPRAPRARRGAERPSADPFLRLGAFFHRIARVDSYSRCFNTMIPPIAPSPSRVQRSRARSPNKMGGATRSASGHPSICHSSIHSSVVQISGSCVRVVRLGAGPVVRVIRRRVREGAKPSSSLSRRGSTWSCFTSSRFARSRARARRRNFERNE